MHSPQWVLTEADCAEWSAVVRPPGRKRRFPSRTDSVPRVHGDSRVATRGTSGSRRALRSGRHRSDSLSVKLDAVEREDPIEVGIGDDITSGRDVALLPCRVAKRRFNAAEAQVLGWHVTGRQPEDDRSGRNARA